MKSTELVLCPGTAVVTTPLTLLVSLDEQGTVYDSVAVFILGGAQAERAPLPPDSCGSGNRSGFAEAFNAAVAGPRSFRGAVAATPEGSTGSAVTATQLAVF